MAPRRTDQDFNLYGTVSEVLMFDGMVAPDEAHHLAHLISLRSQYLLDCREFGAAQIVVGNTLIDHCGWYREDTVIEYHMADMVNEAMLRQQEK